MTIDLETLMTGVVEFFSAISWGNVIQSFIGSVNGIDWDSLGSLFDWFDFSDGPLQAIFDTLFGQL